MTEARLEKVKYMIKVYVNLCKEYPRDKAFVKMKRSYENELEKLLGEKGK